MEIIFLLEKRFKGGFNMSNHFVTERDQRLANVTDVQRDFLLNYVKRGKRTVFSNFIAEQKGATLSDELSLEDVERNLQDWHLKDIIDSGSINPDTRCECGRPLRYQYIVEHQSTKKVLKFGINHFEEHMGIPASVVQDIRNGFTNIDYELDELLEKIEDGFDSSSYLLDWPEDLIVPEHILAHIEAKVPLLDRQIERLRIIKERYYIENRAKSFEQAKVQIVADFPNAPSPEPDLFNFDTFDEPKNNATQLEEVIVLLKENNKDSDFVFGDIVYQLVLNGVHGVNEISEILIENFQASDARFLSGRPKIIVNIVKYLEQYVQTGELHVTNDSSIHNRFYVPVIQQ